jgi:hypothetical protein
MTLPEIVGREDSATARMEMYADPAEALEAVGLPDQDTHAE